MEPRPGLSVDEVAARLHLTPRRVRSLIADGQLSAVKLGGSWVVDSSSLPMRSASRPSAGRPFAPQNAWALIWIASGDPRLQSLARSWVSPWMYWYLSNHARREPILQLAPRLRRRASLERLRGHPGDLPRLVDEPSLVVSGVSAAREHHFDIASSDVLEAYVSARSLATLRRRYLLRESASPNCVFHVVDSTLSAWPFPRRRRVAPAILVALDLFDAGDSRSRRAAAAFLAGQLPQ